MDLLKGYARRRCRRFEKAAEICANSIANNGLVFLFGNGHSRMMCEEMTPRQGCYPGFLALSSWRFRIMHRLSVRTDCARRLSGEYEGYAEEILKGFHFGPHDAFIVISTSGIRPVIVEMAMGAKSRGLPVIGICSREHCEQSVPGALFRERSLIDVADVILDNQCPPGDCILELEGLEWRTCPTSTVTGAMIINMLARRDGRTAARARPQTRVASQPSVCREHGCGHAT